MRAERLGFSYPQHKSGQELVLAAIMARRPPVLVLDKPLSMLDAGAAVELVEHLRALADGGTAVMACEHREVYLRHLPRLRTLRFPACFWCCSLGRGSCARRRSRSGG